MKSILTRVYAVYPLAIPLAIWVVSQIGHVLSQMFPELVMFTAETQQWTISFSSAEIVTGITLGLATIWGVFTKWGVKR